MTSASACPTAVDVRAAAAGGQRRRRRLSRSAQAIRNSSRRRSARTAADRLRRGSPTCRSAAAAKPSQQRLAGSRAPARRRRPAAAAPPGRGPAGRRRSGTARAAGPAAGHRALVAQQPQVPRGAAERVGDLPVGEQARGRARARRRTRCSSTGSRVRWIAAVRRHPAGQRLEVAQRPGRVGEAEDLQPLPGRLRASAAAPSAGTRATASSSGR